MTATAPTQAVQAQLPNHTTRVLCSAVLTEEGFAELVYRALGVPQVQALAPSPGIDLAMLTRHAAHAVKQRQRRQVAMSVALSALLLPVLGLAGGVPPAVCGVLALAILVGARAWSLASEVAMAQKATKLIDPGMVEDLGAGMLDHDQEQRLAAVNDANLSIYSWQRADDPFPGLGQRVDAYVRMPVDVSRAKDDKKPVLPVTTSDLLDHLARAIPGYIDVTYINDARRVRMVLYVLGSAVDQVPGLLVEPNGPSVVRVPPQMLKVAADKPSGDARTYLRAQIVGRSGQVVTTLHLTAVISRVGLSLDVALHVLRPVHEAFYVADRLPRSLPRLSWHVFQRGRLSPGLLRAPGDVIRCAAMLREGRKSATLTPKQRKAVGAHDFHGARLGIREATSYNSKFNFNEHNDAERQSNDLLAVVLRELITFLDDHNIDTSDFRQQQMQIINNFNSAVSSTINGNYLTGQSSMQINGGQQINQKNMPNLGPTGP